MRIIPILLIFLIIQTEGIFACQTYQVLTPMAQLQSFHGKIEIFQGERASPIRKTCWLHEGDSIHLLTPESYVVLKFKNGKKQVIYGKSKIEFSPLFYTKPMSLNWHPFAQWILRIQGSIPKTHSI